MKPQISKIVSLIESRDPVHAFGTARGNTVGPYGAPLNFHVADPFLAVNYNSCYIRSTPGARLIPNGDRIHESVWWSARGGASCLTVPVSVT